MICIHVQLVVIVILKATHRIRKTYMFYILQKSYKQKLHQFPRFNIA